MHAPRSTLLVLLLCALGACPGGRGSSSTGAEVEPPPTGGGSPMAGDPLVLGETPRGGSDVSEAVRAEQAARREVDARARWKKLQDKHPKPADVAEAARKAEKLGADGNHKEARDACLAILVHAPSTDAGLAAGECAMGHAFALNEYGEGLATLEDALFHVDDALARARIHRLLGNTYLVLPHWGTRKGGEFLRNRWDQGTYTQTFREDRALAIAHLEDARDLLAELPADKPRDAERLDTLLDLVGALARFTVYDGTWTNWWYADRPDDGLEEEEGEDEMAGEYRGRRGRGMDFNRAQPRGMEVTPDGQVVFVARPEKYARDLPEVARMKFVLDEVRKLDASPSKEHAARSLMWQAMLFRSRDGVERLERLGTWWWMGDHPYKKDVEAARLQDLADDEVLGLVATHIGVYKPPPDENVPALLRQLIAEHPKSPEADEARVVLGIYHQSRRQYLAALKEYDAYLAATPNGTHASTARSNRAIILRTDLQFIEGGVQPAGRNATVKLRHRNTDRIKLTATRVDLEKAQRDFEADYRRGSRRDRYVLDPDNAMSQLVHNLQEYKQYLTDDVLHWEQPVQRDPAHLHREDASVSPITKPGLWFLQARSEGKSDDARGVIMLEPFAVVQKAFKDGTRAWVVDAMTGVPVAGAEVSFFEYWHDYENGKSIPRFREHSGRTGEDGLVDRPRADHQMAMTVRKGNSVVHAGYHGVYSGYSRWDSGDDRVDALVMTDRPVYRPGDTMKAKAWARVRRGGVWQPAETVKNVMVQVRDARGAELLLQTLDAHGNGSVDVELPLKKGAPLGMYTITVAVNGQHTNAGGGAFRVEEYKAPEFTVNVSVDGHARLGQPFKAAITGNYLFGGGVAGGRVRYRVYREDYQHQYTAPGPWDWLYGRGYGRCWYAYPWFDWWHELGPRAWHWYPWWGPPPRPARELVKEGEGRLDADGKLLVTVDTAQAKRDMGKTDHKYVVEAEVTDSSRRLIKGEGEILVTRNAYFASIEAERGWYAADDDLKLSVTTVKADGAGLSVTGKLLVEEVVFRGDNGDTITEKPVHTMLVTTLAEGPVDITWRSQRTGQFKFTFVGADEWGGEVRASTVAWVAGPGFHGNKYKFAGLELLTDKRTYKAGDTARIMVNVNRAGASVLLATRVESGTLLDARVMDMPAKTRMVEIPITAAHVPNFFIEAATVAEGTLFQEARELHVPPQDAVLNVKVAADKTEYRPGDEAELVVTTTNDDGKPVSADVALTVMDSAVLYIQKELTPDIRAHFWARKRTHHVNSVSNLLRRFEDYPWYAHQDPHMYAVNELQGINARFFQAAVDLRSGATVGLKGSLAALGAAGSGPGGGGRQMESAARAAAPAAEAKADSADKDSSARNEAEAPADDRAPKEKQERPDQPGAEGARTRVRSKFADTALWAPTVRTDTSGQARVKVKFPDNLTTWRIKAMGMDGRAAAGQVTTSVLTTKKLLVRLETPRFFRERDHVVLSATVHNKFPTPQSVDVALTVPTPQLSAQGPVQRKVTVPAGGEVRVDFSVTAEHEGDARLLVTATGGAESDAKEVVVPVLVHGMTKTVSGVGSVAASARGDAEKKVVVEVPEARRPEQTTLVVRWSPSLAGAMLDALPYLLEYPYGCTEQTLSRFIPAVLTRKVLQDSGLKLSDLGGPHTNLDAQQLTPGGAAQRSRLEKEHRRWHGHPVFNDAVLQDMIEAGMARITRFQRPDGGWGWWSNDTSSVYTTTYVMMALKDAQDADMRVDPSVFQRGRQALAVLVERHLEEYRTEDYISDADAFAAWVMARLGDRNDKLLRILWERKAKLSTYGKLLATLAFHAVGDRPKAEALMRNAEQLLREDKENETAWLDTARDGWWHWWNDEIETNAMYLRALDALRPKDERASEVVKWLLHHRKNGWYWNSTRDTAMVVAAMAGHMKVSGEDAPDYDLDVTWDGHVLKTVHIDEKNLFTYDGEVTIQGAGLAGGRHEIGFKRRGKGAVYFNTYLSFFTLEEDVKAAGLEVKVERRYFKLERADRHATKFGDRGQATQQTEVAYRPVPLETGAKVQSGDLVMVELMLTSKNDYEFLAFEDPKPAGMEPEALRSGTTYGEAVANMELRDDKVVFFLSTLAQGKLRLTYRLRAQIPGEFHAMPTFGFGMYAPEIRANSDEMRVQITDTAP